MKKFTIDITGKTKSDILKSIDDVKNQIASDNLMTWDEANSGAGYSFDSEGEYEVVPKKYARKCDFTGEGMNEGWVMNDGEKYAKYENDALKWCEENGYESIEVAYCNNACYHTEWTDESDYQYEEVDGKLIEIED